MSKVKITVTIEEELVKSLARWSKMAKESRSSLVEKAIKVWHQSILQKELIEGYQAMNKENLSVAESHLKASSEILR